MKVKDVIGRADLEKAIYEFTDFQMDQARVNGLMAIIDAYVAKQVTAINEAPAPVVQSLLHSQMTLAEYLLDTGGRMQLVRSAGVPPVAAPVAEPVQVTKPTKVTPPQPDPVPVSDGELVLTCTGCKLPKLAATNFSRKTASKNGYNTRCRDCINQARRDRKRGVAA